jgi:hypothetical protein
VARRGTSEGLLALAISLSLLTMGCIPKAGGAPSPAPSPPASLPETSREERARLDFAAAEHAYRGATAEVNRLLMVGGADGPTKVLLTFAEGKFLDFTVDVLRSTKNSKTRTTAPLTIAAVAPSGGWSENRIRLTACEDATKVRVLDLSGKDVTPKGMRRAVQQLTVVKSGDSWKVADAETTLVKSFENQAGCVT